MKRRYLALAALGSVAAAIYAVNASWLAQTPTERPLLLAHRGVYQRYDRKGLANDTCTAARIFKPTNRFLENTLPSMRASLEAGADVIEVDVHPTTDGDFAVFHDWAVDCRTDGHGVTRAHTMAQLKALDIGYGYTYDGGKTFPFRGEFKGAMPSLAETLRAFPDARFLINIKSNDPSEADRLDAYLKAHPQARPERLSAYGGVWPISRLAQLRPGLRPYSRKTLKACALGYMAVGWTGYMPQACRRTTILLPLDYTWAAWGYPNRLQARFRAAGSYIYLLGPQNGKAGLEGVNTPEQLAKVPPHWGMGVLTDSIETIGPAMRPSERSNPSPERTEPPT
ncbi:MAG: glycerophosphodiester phosphodiesterase family protein [Phenylobacterium sp.]